MTKYRKLEVLVYGQNMVDVRRGAKRVHVNTLNTWDDALAFADELALLLQCEVKVTPGLSAELATEGDR